MAHISAKKYGHHTILRWYHTNLGLLYMMVPSDWQGNFLGGFTSIYSVPALGSL
jgi:hypothetical protein